MIKDSDWGLRPNLSTLLEAQVENMEPLVLQITIVILGDRTCIAYKS